MWFWEWIFGLLATRSEATEPDFDALREEQLLDDEDDDEDDEDAPTY